MKISCKQQLELRPTKPDFLNIIIVRLPAIVIKHSIVQKMFYPAIYVLQQIRMIFKRTSFNTLKHASKISQPLLNSSGNNGSHLPAKNVEEGNAIAKRREEERIRQEKERHASVPPRGQADPLGTYTPSLVLQPVPPLPDNLHYSLEPSAPPHLPHDRPDDLRLTPSVPGVDRTTKPHSLLSPSTNNSQLVPGLRTVIIPQVLHARFIKLAQVSTERNIETCGILAGRLQRDQLVVSHLLVPKQHGGADYCNMEGEEEICAYSDQRELLTLGWIHTHPTQSAFLSSVDLHTHFSYQLMMPEAIAIVCAPKYQEVKVFCLTPHHGLNFIKNCRQPGFHPHPNDPPLFMVAEHYRMDGAAPLEVVDLRR